MSPSSLPRRRFLASSSLVCGAAAIPEWIAQAFGVQDKKPGKRDHGAQKKRKAGQGDKPSQPGSADDRPPQPPRRDPRPVELRAACRRAKAHGKPLLMLVVPKNAADVFDVGYLFGALLNHGGADVLLDLALCEVACGTQLELQKIAGVAAAKSEPLMVLVDFPAPDQKNKAPVVTRITVPKPAAGWFPRTWDPNRQSLEEFERLDGRDARARNRKLAAVLRRHVVADAGALASRADRARARLAADDRAAVAGFLAGSGKLTPALTLQAAAVLRMAARAPRRKGDAKRLHDAVVAAARKVYVQSRMRGARWASTDGCGADVEGEPPLGVECGSGHVPALSARFLYFLEH